MSVTPQIVGYALCPVHGRLVGLGANLHLVDSCPGCLADAVEAEAKLARDHRSGQAVDGGAEEA